jgi:predicted short-subunit dehydrogenase-like oxidoreductase (DUF2520 family)
MGLPPAAIGASVRASITGTGTVSIASLAPWNARTVNCGATGACACDRVQPLPSMPVSSTRRAARLATERPTLAIERQRRIASEYAASGIWTARPGALSCSFGATRHQNGRDGRA